QIAPAREGEERPAPGVGHVETQARRLVAQPGLAPIAVGQLDAIGGLAEVAAQEHAQEAPSDPEAAPVALEVKALLPRALVLGEPAGERVAVLLDPFDGDAPDMHFSLTKGTDRLGVTQDFVGDRHHATPGATPRSSAMASSRAARLSS